MRLKKERREGNGREEDKFKDFYSIYSTVCRSKKDTRLTQVCIRVDSNFPDWIHRKVHLKYWHVSSLKTVGIWVIMKDNKFDRLVGGIKPNLVGF